MIKLLDFLAKWHILFIILSLILIFALIGYFVERKRHKKAPFKIPSKSNDFTTIDIKNLDNTMSLKDALSNNINKKSK